MERQIFDVEEHEEPPRPTQDSRKHAKET